MTEQQYTEIQAIPGSHNAQLRESLRANARSYERKLEWFYSRPLSGEKRDILEREFDEMNTFHQDSTGQALFSENPVRVSKAKLIAQPHGD